MHQIKEQCILFHFNCESLTLDIFEPMTVLFGFKKMVYVKIFITVNKENFIIANCMSVSNY